MHANAIIPIGNMNAVMSLIHPGVYKSRFHIFDHNAVILKSYEITGIHALYDVVGEKFMSNEID